MASKLQWIVGMAISVGALTLLTKKASATPQGTLNIISCPSQVNVSSDGSATISITVQALNGNISQYIKIIAGTYINSQLITLNENQTSIVTFKIPSVTTTTQYTVSVI